MYRIDNATSATSLPAPLPIGSNPNGYFTINSLTPTIVDPDWLNAIQEELCFVITQAGLTLSKTTRTQLYSAILSLLQGLPGAASTSAANTYTASLSPAPLSYTTNMAFTITFTNANTGAATLNLNALGAQAIKRLDGTALQANDIVAGMIGFLVYNGTNFQLLNRFIPAPAALVAPQTTILGAGSGTYSTPAGCLYLEVFGWGPGGGGGGATGGASQTSVSVGGSAGGYFYKKINSPLSSYAYSVGTGGIGGFGGGGASGSGATTFGTSFLTANVGLGGIFVNANSGNGFSGTPQAGGTATGGDINIPGGSPLASFVIVGTTGQGMSGAGGAAYGGTQAPGIYGNTQTVGVNGESPGCGGSGAASVSGTPFRGGNGADGQLIIVAHFQ